MSVTPTSAAARLLLLRPHGHDLFALGRVEAAGIAVGHDAVADLNSCRGPGRDGSGGAEVDIVRVGGKTKHPLNPLVVRR